MKSNKSKIARVAFYIRISTNEEVQKYSLLGQEQQLRAYCRSQYGDRWTLHKAYRDEASASNVNRPALQQMLKDARERAFDVLLVWRLDRLSRRLRDTVDVVDMLSNSDVALVSATEPFDMSVPTSRLLLLLLTSYAEFEQATISERMKIGMAVRATKGEYTGKTVPYGYARRGKRLALDEAEAILVRRVFDLYASEGRGSSTIAKVLNEAGSRKRTGREWLAGDINSMLKNPLYAGKVRLNGRVYGGRHQAIVAEESFLLAQEVRQWRTVPRIGDHGSYKKKGLLAGILRCGICGSPMIFATLPGHIQRYRCPKRRLRQCQQRGPPAGLLEHALVADLKSLLGDERFANSVRRQASRMLRAERLRVEAVLKKGQLELKRIGVIEDRYAAAFGAQSLSRESCQGRLDEVESRRSSLIGKQNQLAARHQLLSEPPAFCHEGMLAGVLRLEQLVLRNDYRRSRPLAQLFIAKVVVGKDLSCEVHYRLPTSHQLRGLSVPISSQLRWPAAQWPDVRLVALHKGEYDPPPCQQALQLRVSSATDGHTTTGRIDRRLTEESRVDAFVRLCRARRRIYIPRSDGQTMLNALIEKCDGLRQEEGTAE